MIACRVKPHRALAEFVEDFWLYDGYASAHARERILPSGTFELVVNLRENELRIYDSLQPGRCRRYAGSVISGPYAGYFVSDAVEEVSIMGVHFKPGGAFPFLGFPAGEFADAHVDLAEIWKGEAESLRGQVAEMSNPLERIRLLEHRLIQHLRRPLEHHPAVATALAAHRRPGVGTRTRELSRAVGLSERRFIDVFRREVGMTPKVFDRVQRFQRALRSLGIGPARQADHLQRSGYACDWAALAAVCGYYDQSHLIRDFRAFTGVAPTDYVRRIQEIRAQGAHAKPNHLAFRD